MAVQTPKQMVEARFGTKKDLVDQIIGLTGGTDEDRSSLMGTTNKKLLRIHDASKLAKDKFGGKSALIDALAKATFPKGSPNEGWREKMEKRSVKRLLDDHRKRA